MSLNNYQKNYIKKKYKRRKVEEIAEYLKIPEDLIISHIKENLGIEKYEKFAMKGLEEKKIFSFNFLVWIKANKFILLFLTIAVFTVYVNSLSADFVSDDKGIVQNAPTWNFDTTIAQRLTILRQIFYDFIYKIFGLSPLVFRLLNILLHIGSVLSIYLLLDLMTNKKTAFFSALIFAVHPIIVESVTWISGGVYAQYAFFFLLSFIFYFLYRNVNRKIYFYFSLLFFSFSLLSSEKASVLFLIFPLFEICQRKFKENWKKTIIYPVISLILLILYFSRIGQRVNVLQSEFYQDSKGFDNPLIQIPVAIVSYLSLIVWPSDLTLYHSELVFSRTQYIFILFIFILFLTLLIYSFFKKREIFFWLTFFIIGLLPTLTPFRIAWVVAERYVYIGSIGLFTLIGIGVNKLSSLAKFKMPIYTVFTLLIIGLAIRSVVRNIDWQNEDNLWIATGKTSPSSPNTHNNLGDVYGRHGDLAGSVAEFKRAIAIKPNYADAYHNLGNAYSEMKNYNEALKSYEKAIYYNPKLWQSYENVAVIYFQEKKYKPAIDNMQKAIDINPGMMDLRINLAVIYFNSGEKEKAKEILQSVLRADPINQKAREASTEILK